MCFAKYEDDILSGSGAEWISCSCGRWLHEECAEDCVIDNNGKERLVLRFFQNNKISVLSNKITVLSLLYQNYNIEFIS